MRRQDPFALWITEYGVARLVRDLAAAGASVTPGTVYRWRNGTRRPWLYHAGPVMDIAAGRLRWEDILSGFSNRNT